MMVCNDKYLVDQIEGTDARRIVEKYHYSGKVVANSCLNLGVFENSGYFPKLVGCLQFGPLRHGPKTSSKISDEPSMYELNRMVLDNEQERNSESMAIGLCVKWLKKNTDIKWLLSFSDGKQGNVGYIYQATNWKYIG